MICIGKSNSKSLELNENPKTNYECRYVCIDDVESQTINEIDPLKPAMKLNPHPVSMNIGSKFKKLANPQ